MLRFEYMPSDFQPVFLFLGEGPDLAALAKLLRRFAERPQTYAVAERIPGATSCHELVLTAAEDGEFGMRDLGGLFTWKLTDWQAARIAERIESLTSQDNKSGSEILNIGSEGEIPVKISRGEFTDDFLVTRR